MGTFLVLEEVSLVSQYVISSVNKMTEYNTNVNVHVTTSVLRKRTVHKRRLGKLRVVH